MGIANTPLKLGRRQRGGQWCPAPRFEICAPPFRVWSLHTSNKYFKIWPPLLVFAPPLLLNPGDGPALKTASFSNIV